MNSTFLSEIHDDPGATLLGTLNALLNAVGEIGSARANVTSENVAAVAFIMSSKISIVSNKNSKICD